MTKPVQSGIYGQNGQSVQLHVVEEHALLVESVSMETRVKKDAKVMIFGSNLVQMNLVSIGRNGASGVNVNPYVPIQSVKHLKLVL